MTITLNPLESRPKEWRSSVRRLFNGLLPSLLLAVGLAVVFLVAGLARFGSIGATVACLQGYALWPELSTREMSGMHADTPTPVTFELLNLTDHPVTVIGADACCGCFVSSDLPVIIPPGDKQAITVTVVAVRSLVGQRLQWDIVLFLDTPGPRPILSVIGTVCEASDSHTANGG